MYDQPGSRVHVTNDTGVALPNGAAAYIQGHVGFIEKNTQLDRWVKPGSEEATHVMPNETCVVFVTDVHELALAGLLANVGVGDKLYIDGDSQTVLTAPGGGEGAANEKQSVKVQGTGGFFKLTIPVFEDPAEQFKVKWNVTAAEMQAIVNALLGIEPGDVVITGGPTDEAGTNPYIFTFGGRLADTDVAAITSDVTELTGGEHKTTITTSTAGAGSVDTVMPLGVVDAIDTARTPDVALVNLSDLKPFITS